MERTHRKGFQILQWQLYSHNNFFWLTRHVCCGWSSWHHHSADSENCCCWSSSNNTSNHQHVKCPIMNHHCALHLTDPVASIFFWFPVFHHTQSLVVGYLHHWIFGLCWASKPIDPNKGAAEVGVGQTGIIQSTSFHPRDCNKAKTHVNLLCLQSILHKSLCKPF